MPKARVQKGPSPRAVKGSLARLLTRMERGDWILMSHVRAKSAVRVAKQLGGAACRYQVSDRQTCVKVLEAPWRKHSAAA